jgi:hypothetical protein
LHSSWPRSVPAAPRFPGRHVQVKASQSHREAVGLGQPGGPGACRPSLAGRTVPGSGSGSLAGMGVSSHRRHRPATALPSVSASPRPGLTAAVPGVSVPVMAAVPVLPAR